MLLAKKLPIRIPTRNVSQHENKQSLKGGPGEGGENIRVSSSCCLTTSEVGFNENTVVFHSMIMLSMAEGPSSSFVLIRDGDRSIFCFPFDSEFLNIAQTK